MPNRSEWITACIFGPRLVYERAYCVPNKLGYVIDARYKMTQILTQDSEVRLAIPKGRMFEQVSRLLADAGLPLSASSRSYRPSVPIPGVETKLLKPQNIVEMLHIGRRDLGFAGADWVSELSADIVELCDTGLNPVRIIAAAPRSLLDQSGDISGPITVSALPNTPLVVASEYATLANNWIKKHSIDGTFVRAYGATEVFPPDDADVIIDNTSTGSTLRANNLLIVDELMRSSTRLYASKAAMADEQKKLVIQDFVMLINAVIEARSRVMVEFNATEQAFKHLIGSKGNAVGLPCMKTPTVSPLLNNAGFAVRIAIPRDQLAIVVPQIRKAGGSDIVVTRPGQIIP